MKLNPSLTERPHTLPRRTLQPQKRSRTDNHKLSMSLYYETATILENPDQIGGSFKARIFKKKDLKSKPGQIYALVAEASKWSRVLKDVIEKCAVLKEERKVCCNYLNHSCHATRFLHSTRPIGEHC